MRGRGTIALIIFILIGNGVTSNESVNDLRDFLHYQSRSGLPAWEAESESESGQESATDSGESKYHSDESQSQGETKVELSKVVNIQPSIVEEATTSTATPTENTLANLDDSRKSATPHNSLRSRTLRLEEYILLEDLVDNYGFSCNTLGQMYYYTLRRGFCLICVCLYRESNLTPVCAACDGCVSENVKPDIYGYEVAKEIKELQSTMIPYDTTPLNYGESESALVELKEASCSPLPEGVPFQHPLNPCQTCLCSRSMSLYGNVEVKIACQENRQCVLPLNPIALPDNTYVALPQCQEFPANVLFPHPTEQCKQCQCNDELQQVICYDVPGCTLQPDAGEQLPTIDPALIDVFPSVESSQSSNQYETDVPDLNIPKILPEIYSSPTASQSMQVHFPPDSGAEVLDQAIEVIPETTKEDELIPTTTAISPHILRDNEDEEQGPIPRSPLPGPRPHKTCEPFKSNQPFQHPWDVCQVCVCTEARSLPFNDIEVNCFTKSSCCYSEDGVLAKQNLVTEHKTTVGDNKPTIDAMCETEVLGEPFAHPYLTCNECVCKQFDNHVAPVCNYASRPECSGLIGGKIETTTIGGTGLTYTDLQCRYHNLYEVFVYECQRCTCFTWRDYQIRASCVIIPGCAINNHQLIKGQSVKAVHLTELLGSQKNQQNSLSYDNAGSSDFGITMKPFKYSYNIPVPGHLYGTGSSYDNEKYNDDFGLEKVISGGHQSYSGGQEEGFYRPGDDQGIAIYTAADLYGAYQSMIDSDSQNGLLVGQGGNVKYDIGNKLLSSTYQGDGQGYLANSGVQVSHKAVIDGSHVPLYTQTPLNTGNWHSSSDSTQFVFPQNLEIGKIKQSWQNVPLPVSSYSHKVQYPVSYSVKYSGSVRPQNYVSEFPVQPLGDFQPDLEPGYHNYAVQLPRDYKYPPSYLQSQYDLSTSKPHEDKSGNPHHQNQVQIPLSLVKQGKSRKQSIVNEKSIRIKNKHRIKSGHPDDQQQSSEERT